MQLTYLKIHYFRNVKPGTELRFGAEKNVVLGRNGSGKTTLLKLIAQLVRLDFDELAYERVHVTYRMENDGDSVDVVLSIEPEDQTQKELGLVAQTLLPGSQTASSSEWKVDIDVRFGDVRRIVRLTHEESLWRDPMIEGGFDAISHHIGLARLGDQTFFALMTTVQPPYNFAKKPLFRRMLLRLDEGLSYFQALTERGAAGVLVTHFTHDETPRVVDRVLVPSSWFMKPITLRTIGTISENSNDNALLGAFARIAGFRHVRLDMPFRKEQPSEGVTFRLFEGLTLTLTLPNGVRFTHQDLSFGQKRLFAFLYYAALEHDGGILVVDELVNGLHHEWIAECLDCIADRQAFLTSQNPLLLDHLGFDGAVDAQRSFIRCELDEEHNWVWRQFTDDEAHAFYRAVDVGYQHVSEILRDQGLW